jgi:hypothetical protein
MPSGAVHLIYIYGYLNLVRSSRRLQLECHRNIEVIWLLRSLKPDFKTIAEARAARAPDGDHPGRMSRGRPPPHRTGRARHAAIPSAGDRNTWKSTDVRWQSNRQSELAATEA